MVNDDILGGLKSALSRGYSLEKAMLSFFNAGYKREEIEEAAKTLQMETARSSKEIQPQPIWSGQESNQPAKPNSNKPQLKVPVQQANRISGIYAPPAKKQVQEVAQTGVSAYRSQGQKTSAITIILVILLVLLLGILGIMYLFKDQIIQFFNGLF
ncbi:MAG: hypothetical protein M1165_00890 [Candidatus Pacearchaeota archaeon]|nr:hypothetical protein [Candidatus Pacearchaeota archaeon]MDE1848961.1 hypothetical protein [Nanoarchaeota archaeon]